MNNEQWSDLKEKIRTKGIEISEKTEDATSFDDLGNKIPAKKEVLEFSTEMGKIKIERTSRPKILDKKAHYHKGTGGQAKLEYVLSPDEISHKVEVFRRDEDLDEWRPLDIPTERLSF